MAINWKTGKMSSKALPNRGGKMTAKPLIDAREVEGIVTDVWGYPVRKFYYYRGVPIYEMDNNTFVLFEYKELPHASFRTLKDAQRNIDREMKLGYYK